MEICVVYGDRGYRGGEGVIVVTLREVLASFADKVIGVSGRGGLSKVFALENPADVHTG